MKILIDGRLLSEHESGISRYTKEIIYFYNNKFGISNVDVLLNRDCLDIDNNKIITRLRPFRIIHFLISRFFLLRTAQYDIVHSPFYSFGLPRYISKIKILTIHDLMYRLLPDFFSKNIVINNLAIQYYDFIVKQSIDNASHLISVSSTTQQDITNFSGRDSILVPEGINKVNSTVPKRPKGLNNISGFFLYVGNKRRHKNFDKLIELFKTERLSNYNLVVCGTPLSYTVTGNVIDLGYISDSELYWLYKECLALIYPSQYEGFGLPVLEALDCSAKVICSNGGALDEFPEGIVFKFNVAHFEEIYRLIEGVNSLAVDNIKTQKLLNNHSWAQVMATLDIELDNIIGSR